MRFWRTEPTAADTHASWRSGLAAGMQLRRRGSVRPEQPERTVTMSFSIGPTESQHQNRPPSSTHTAADPDRHQLRPPAAGCPGEREGLWHRRTLFWRTSSGVQVVSPRVGARLVSGFGSSRRLGPGLCWNTVCFDITEVEVKVEDKPAQSHFTAALMML